MVTFAAARPDIAARAPSAIASRRISIPAMEASLKWPRANALALWARTLGSPIGQRAGSASPWKIGRSVGWANSRVEAPMVGNDDVRICPPCSAEIARRCPPYGAHAGPVAAGMICNTAPRRVVDGEEQDAKRAFRRGGGPCVLGFAELGSGSDHAGRVGIRGGDAVFQEFRAVHRQGEPRRQRRRADQ